MYDEQWVIGDQPVSTLNFNNNSIALDSIAPVGPYFLTNADICDEQGNLLYVTDGLYIGDRNGDTLENGTGINPCGWTTESECCGLDIPQAALFIPKPGDSRYFYLLHFSFDALDSGRPGTIYYSLIDRNGNGNKGSVVQKNVPIIQDVVLRGGGMTACKHANGRDYWIVMGGFNSDTFYRFLLTPDTIAGPFVQAIGPIFPPPGDIAYSKFSQDGSKYVTGIYQGPVLVMDFDRCSGLFSNPDSIFNQSCGPGSCSGSGSVEFSPSGRFIYVGNVTTLNQYDLQASNIQDSVMIYYNDSTQLAELATAQIAPNGKIYISTWNGGYYYMHVINNPDAKGDSCGFVYGGQTTKSADCMSVPNLINYKLGPLVGSGCDTISAIKEQIRDNRQLRIAPNPADKYVYVEMGMPGDYEFDLVNTFGQLIASKQTRQVDIFDTEGLADGVYFIKAINRQNLREAITKKVIVVH